MCSGGIGSRLVPDQKLEQFKTLLKLRGLSMTSERQQILRAIVEFGARFSVDDLYFAMHERGMKTSKATIYRTIQLLLESGIVNESALSGRQASYELAEPGEHRLHMVCQHCGQSSEIRGADVDRFVAQISESNDFLPLAVQIKFSGICVDCVEANPISLRRETCVPFLKYYQSRQTKSVDAT